MEEQEVCRLCGREVYEDSAVEILDGYICEECSCRLSPWFKGQDMAEIEELESQIQAREENFEALRDFHPTRQFGDGPMVLVDDDAKTFVALKDCCLEDENPEIIPIQDVIDCSVDVEEEREKIGSGLYRYSYQFYVKIDLDHPYLDEIAFYLNEDPLCYESEEKSFLGLGGFDPENEEDYQYLARMSSTLEDVLNDLEDPDDRTDEYDIDPEAFESTDEEDYEDDSEEEYDENEDYEEESENSEDSFIRCPWCGSRIRADYEGNCPHCGGSL